MTHRTILDRIWLGPQKRVNWIMLNPSTACDIFNDPTIRKCIGFSKLWGFSEMVVTNLFSVRATYQKDLKRMVKEDYRNAVGKDNDTVLLDQAAQADLVVAAWGTSGNLAGRDQEVMNHLLPSTTLYCIGLTKDGFPLHPCMAKYTDEPIIFRVGGKRNEP